MSKQLSHARFAAVSVLSGAIALLVSASARAPHPPASDQAQSGPRLVWSDEFDAPGPLPDPKRWNYDVGGHGWGNAELQFYTRERRANARVEDGHLIVEAHRERWEKNEYTSARLVTRERGDWRYGRFEARARVPAGRGSWPAIWMLPTTRNMRWPDDGEIDIMEHVGFNPGVIHGSVHTKRYHHSIGTQKTNTIRVPDATTAFHVYAVEWTSSQIRWFVDGREYYAFAREEGGRDVWPFDRPFHIIVNVAVGGSWGGQKGIEDEALPFRLEVDYVRVYQ